MKILIDTHCWLWGLASPSRLNEKARGLMEDGGIAIYLSAASSWEIAIKTSLGKLNLPEPPHKYVPKRLVDQGMQTLPIEHAHALHVSMLPAHHKDPFDRMLVAQAQMEKMCLLTADEQITRYDVDIIWAGQGTEPAAK